MGFRGWAFGSRVQEIRGSGSGSRVSGLGLRVQGIGLRFRV